MPSRVATLAPDVYWTYVADGAFAGAGAGFGLRGPIGLTWRQRSPGP
jgi:hypothetical protein